ncbi:hypothetical protein [Pyxidicoccus xibeiensis]|uniref:hypothetical protein n=1 Tax=Pyxidicoccus xibeiensis TaxID=2906759 RepID=UPI0020A817D6|nr:hypothetical protein [Pyxidicoccus xibeiensis]MCP3140975.1 hypothetical protein [Pyxidicoccus xibeiensis]
MKSGRKTARASRPGTPATTARKPASKNVVATTPPKVNEGRRELRRGNLSRSSSLLNEATGTPDKARAFAYLGLLKGGLGYLRRPESEPLWPTGADEDFTQALQDFPKDAPVWRAWTLAQQAEARRIHMGSRFAVMSHEAFSAEVKSITDLFDQAAKLAKKTRNGSGPTSPQLLNWIHAHRAATDVLACMRSLAKRELSEAQRHFKAAQKGFTAARAGSPDGVYPWAAIFSSFLVSMRPKVFPRSRETTAQAVAEGLAGFEEAISQSSDPRQRLQDVPDLLRTNVSSRHKQAHDRIKGTLDLIASVQKPLERALRECDKGKTNEAAQRIEDLLANELSGTHRFVTRCLAGMAYYGRQYDESIRYGTQALTEDPFDSVTRYFVASSLLDKGDELGAPVSQAMQQEMNNQVELLLRMTLHLALRSGPTLTQAGLKQRLGDAGRHLVSLLAALAPPQNGGQAPLGQKAQAALGELLEHVQLPETDLDERLSDAVMKLLGALHGPAAGERGSLHFESILFDHLKPKVVTK